MHMYVCMRFLYLRVHVYVYTYVYVYRCVLMYMYLSELLFLCIKTAFELLKLTKTKNLKKK